jgi:glucosamine--fructose-6-phosphate aminotransferase (isomerizing)
MEKTGKHTFAEIGSQADSWEGVFKRIEQNAASLKKLYKEADEITFTGCGSAYNISHAVAPFFQGLSGKSCRAVHASDLMINPGLFINRNRKNLILGYSRSGNTTESVRALDTAKRAGARTIAVTCDRQSRMAQNADLSITLEEAVEKSVTTTRSLTSMVLAGYDIAAVCTDAAQVRENLKKLPALARRNMQLFQQTGKSIAENGQITKFAFLGSGTYYGLAREAQLKVKEMVLLPSDAYVSLDFQHGPMSNVDQNMLVTIMVSDAGTEFDLELAKNMRTLGGKIFVICDRADNGFARVSDYIIELKTGLGDGIRNVLYMPVLQYMAYYRSLLEGWDPDNPRNLHYFVELEKGAR